MQSAGKAYKPFIYMFVNQSKEYELEMGGGNGAKENATRNSGNFGRSRVSLGGLQWYVHFS